MKLVEFLYQGDLLNKVNDYKPLPFLFGNQSRVMEQLLTIRYGNRVMFDEMVLIPIADVAQMVVMLNGDKWDSIILLSSKDQTTKTERVITETTENVENRNNTRDNKNLISAYNDDVLIVNDGDLSNGTDELNGTQTRTLTDSTTDLKNAYNNLSLSDKNNIMNVVLKDIADLLTLNIY